MSTFINKSIQFVTENQREITNLSFAVFGVMDFVHVYRHQMLKTTLKVTYIARGSFYLATKAFSLAGLPTNPPFFVANVLGIGLHIVEYRNSTTRYDKTKQALGIISNVAYIIFMKYPHTGVLTVALTASSIKVMLSVAPLAKKMIDTYCS